MLGGDLKWKFSPVLSAPCSKPNSESSVLLEPVWKQNV